MKPSKKEDKEKKEIKKKREGIDSLALRGYC
jgi:hypothetical protein